MIANATGTGKYIESLSLWNHIFSNSLGVERTKGGMISRRTKWWPKKAEKYIWKWAWEGWWLDPYLPERTRDTPHLIITPNKSQRPTPANYIIYCIKTPPRYLPHLLLLPFTPIVFDICSSHSSSSLLAKLAPAEPSQSSYRYAAIQSASSL